MSEKAFGRLRLAGEAARRLRMAGDGGGLVNSARDAVPRMLVSADNGDRLLSADRGDSRCVISAGEHGLIYVIISSALLRQLP